MLRSLSVRLDFDREIDDGAMRSLVQWIQENRLGCSFGVLDYLRPPHFLAWLMEAGAEIQMHAFGEDAETVSRHLAALRGSSGYDVVGATVHGSPSGIGYRGDDHLAIFEAAGLSIAEVIGLESHSPMPVVRPGASGASWSEGFLAPPRHLLDGSTKPDDHRQEAVLQAARLRFRDGEHVVVMNHPDLHRDELVNTIGALTSLDEFGSVWTATVRDTAAWVRG